MAHEHHHHDHTVTSLNKAFILGIALNVAFVVVEFAVGLYYGSMGLLSDAGHNLSDVASLLLAMLAFRLAQAPATPRYTYGYKMLHPAPVEGGAIAWTAGVGVVINGFTAWLFMKDKDKDLNVKGAYLHMAADALVSVGVLVSGLVISWTGWTVVDPIVGLVVAGCQGRAPHPCLGDQHYRKCPYGACRVGRAAPYGNGQETAQSGAGNGGDPPCDARIRIFGRTLPRDVLLIARPAGRDCVPAFCGFLRFFRPAGARMLSEKTIRPGKVGCFYCPGQHLCLSGFVFLWVQGTGS